MRTFVFISAIVANLTVVDAITKEFAAHFLDGAAAISVIPGFFDLAYVENRGCAWGMFQGHVWPLAVFGFLALGFIVWKRKVIFGVPVGASRRSRVVMMFAEPILYAGIVGNLIDRLMRGYVIDFLDFHWGTAYHFPCFNLADTFICVAAGLLILCSGAKRIC